MGGEKWGAEAEVDRLMQTTGILRPTPTKREALFREALRKAYVAGVEAAARHVREEQFRQIAAVQADEPGARLPHRPRLHWEIVEALLPADEASAVTRRMAE